MQDILIAGGGPTGLMAGAEAARSGAEVLILEEHGEIGFPDHCAGLVSTTGLNAIASSGNFILNRIRGARIFAPSGIAYEVFGKLTKAAIIDRPKFDKELLRQAESAGVEVQAGMPFDPTIGRKITIIAEGTSARLTRRFGFKVPKSIPAVQLDLEKVDFERDMVELHFGNWAPGFFAWVVPRKEGVRIGLAAYEGVPKQLLDKMMLKNEHFRVLASGARISKPLFGKVVVGGPSKRTAIADALVVGDAGGFVKPTTGGGVILGCLTAKAAGRAAASAVREEIPLSSFEATWRKAYGKEFMIMGIARDVLRNMTAIEMERALEELKKINLLDSLLGYDMDLQGSAVGRVIRSRLARHAIIPLLRSFF
ncbi:MAG: NAD(P)/FAD-dependent oxidoreductase [Candidatus Methanomethylicus sp.]|nr:NAD(P)/FAD-dependent oxidoreductase [Candidatus Methanomethylicus sp.]